MKRFGFLFLFLTLASFSVGSLDATPEVGFAKPGSQVAVLDLFNLTENPAFDPWERLLGRGLRRSLHTYKTQNRIQLEVIPYPRIHKALKELGLDTYYISPEQAPAIGERLQSDLVVLGSFNVVEGVVATSLKIVDNHSGKLLHEETRFGTEDKINEFVKELGETLNGLLLAGVAGQAPPPPPVAVITEPSVPVESIVAPPESLPVEDVTTEPVEEIGIVEEVVGPPAMTQIAGPGGGMAPPPIEDTPAPDVAESVVSPPPSAPPAQPEPNRSVVEVLNQSWQKTQGEVAPPMVAPGAGQAPNQSPYPAVPPPMTPPVQQAVPMGLPSGLPPRAPITMGEPMESRMPPLAPQQQAPPDAVRSPFQPMPAPQQLPPSPEQLGYPMVPPMQNPPYPPGYPPQSPQTAPQRGPVGRFFNWIGRGIGVVEDPATQPAMPNQFQQPGQAPPQQMQQVPQQPAPPPQQQKKPFWDFSRN